MSLGLGIFLYGALKAVTGIGRAVENQEMKKYTYEIDDKGRATWLDRECNRYINGEKVVSKYNYQTGNLYYAGQRSGKVYYDPEADRIREQEERNRKRREEAIKAGRLVYMHEDKSLPFLGCMKAVTKEISTGKCIAALEYIPYKKEFRKYYLAPNPTYPFQQIDGDEGIVITKEEYMKIGSPIGYKGHIMYGQREFDMHHLCGII